MLFTYVTSSDLAGIAIKGNNLIIKFNSGGIIERRKKCIVIIMN